MSADTTYEFTPRAARDLKRLAPDVRERILNALARLTGAPPQGDQRKLEGSTDEWRLRVGDWRVRFLRAPDGRIVVLRVLHRSVAYRD